MENADTPFTGRRPRGRCAADPHQSFRRELVLRLVDAAADTANDQVVLSYVDNPNGSLASVAGLCNEAGNVLGLMPHPERACEPALGSSDGQIILRSMLDNVRTSVA